MTTNGIRNDGWILISDKRSGHLPPTGVVHHVNGCNLSNGRNRLRRADPDEGVETMTHCARCEHKLGGEVNIARPSEGIKVELRLQPDVVEQIDLIARDRGQTRAATMRDLIFHALGSR